MSQAQQPQTPKSSPPKVAPAPPPPEVPRPASPVVTKPAAKKTDMEIFLSNVPGLTDAELTLLKELYIANGQDAFDAEAAAVGRLKQDEYLALPQDFKIPEVKPAEVGRADVVKKFSARAIAAVYYLNKKRAPVGENAVVYGMIRMEAFKMGWVSDQKEIIRVPFDKYTDAFKELTTDLAGVRNQLSTFRLAGFLIPLICEHTFRVTGHHYITGLATDYQTRYRKTLKACLSEELMTLLQPATMFHHVLHWVSPARSYNVLVAQLETRTIPDAMIIRANAAPAGWAVITTTAAVLQAMESANVQETIAEAFEGVLSDVTDASEEIKRDVRKWHKSYFAYGVAQPDPARLKKMEQAKLTAINFAPYAQGFIEGTLKDAALGQAQALKKHAELNPVAKQRAARFFRKLGRTEVNKVEDLFKTSIKETPPTTEDEDE